MILSEKAKLVASVHHIRQFAETEIISQQYLKKVPEIFWLKLATEIDFKASIEL